MVPFSLFQSLISDRITCHSCEVENSFNCTNPKQCEPLEHFCVVAAIHKCCFILGLSWDPVGRTQMLLGIGAVNQK